MRGQSSPAPMLVSRNPIGGVKSDLAKLFESIFRILQQILGDTAICVMVSTKAGQVGN